VIKAKQLLHFGGVGGLAAATHYLVVLLLVGVGLHPLLANVFAFLTAFQVSYFGHRHLTFADSAVGLPHSQTLPRFFLVAVSSFLLNECMFAGLLRYTALPYQLSLGIVLVLVAGLTFVLSRVFAFSA
jgi:putative flippase GtrA